MNKRVLNYRAKSGAFARKGITDFYFMGKEKASLIIQARRAARQFLSIGSIVIFANTMKQLAFISQLLRAGAYENLLELPLV